MVPLAAHHPRRSADRLGVQLRDHPCEPAALHRPRGAGPPTPPDTHPTVTRPVRRNSPKRLYGTGCLTQVREEALRPIEGWLVLPRSCAVGLPRLSPSL